MPEPVPFFRPFWRHLLPRPRALGFLPERDEGTDAAGSSLGRRAFKAASWSLLGHITRQLIRFGGNLVMTRLLVPEAFGIMAIASVLLGGFQLFTDIGLRQNIVQSHKGDDRDFLDTVWTVQILRGAVVFGLALIADLGLRLLQGTDFIPADTVYADPLLPTIIFALSFTALVSGFESTKLGTANRHLLLSRITLLDLATQVFGLLVTLTWAWLSRSVWALVAGSIAAPAARALLSHLMLPGENNRLAWNKSYFAEIFNFGKWVFLSSIAGFLLINADRLLLGGLVGPDTLGRYVIAYLIVNSLQWALLNLVITVSFPLLSEAARGDASQLPRLYYRLRQPLQLASVALAAILFSFGSHLIALFYDARYAEAGRMLEITALALATVPYQLSDQLYLALGNSRLLFMLNAFRTAAIYVTLPLAYAFYQTEGALWAIALTPFLAIPVSLYMNSRLGVMDGRKEAMAGCVALFCVLALKPLSYGI